MNVYLRFLKWVCLAGSTTALVIVFYTSGDVTGRHLFDNPLPASFELTETLMVFLVFLALAYTQATGSHLRIEFFWSRVGKRMQIVLDMFSLLIGLFLLAIITWQASIWTWEAYKTKELLRGVWGMPRYPGTLILTVGAFLLWVQYGINLFQRFQQLIARKLSRVSL